MTLTLDAMIDRILSAVCIVLLAAACNNDILEQSNPISDVNTVRFTVEDFRFAEDESPVTKTAAARIWGDSWRTPTMEEFEELMGECDWYSDIINGVSGFRVVGRVHGNSIFLPAGGYGYQGNVNLRGYDAYYWSSTLERDDTRTSELPPCPDTACGIRCCVIDTTPGKVQSNAFRCVGRLIRPVCPKSSVGEP